MPDRILSADESIRLPSLAPTTTRAAAPSATTATTDGGIQVIWRGLSVPTLPRRAYSGGAKSVDGDGTNSTMSVQLQHWEREQARRWVEARRGHWDHTQWLKLIGELRRAGWVDLDPDTVGRILEREKVRYENLRRWREGGEAWRWVEARRGTWSHHEFMTLLAGLNCWLGPIDAAALGELLNDFARLHHRLGLWVERGTARRWVAERRGEWGHGDWLAFLDQVEEEGFGDVPAPLVGLTLEGAKRDYWNLR